MKFSILTLFPEMFEPIKHSIIDRATKQNLININLINIRDFSKDKHKHVDDTPYGGGAGMVIKPDVVEDAYNSIKADQCVTYVELVINLILDYYPLDKVQPFCAFCFYDE